MADALELNYKTEYGNKLIADFMQRQHHSDPKYDSHEMSNLKYHSDWNCIMSVMLKLHDKDVYGDVHYKNCKISWMDSNNSYELSNGVKADSKILAIWTAIVHFLEWVRDEEIDLDNPTHYE